MDRKGIVIFTVVLVVLLAGLYGLSAWQQTELTGPNDLSPADYSTRPDDHIKGNPEAELVLVKYSDFQCPACASAYPLAAGLVEEFEGQLALVYRHFPLVGQFRHSLTSAQAAEAAAQQGAFWPMHDKLFDGQAEWSGADEVESIFIEYAQEIGLDLEQFQADLSSDDLQEKILVDRQAALELGVESTPSFFLNGEYIESWNQLPEEVQALIQTPVEESEEGSFELDPQTFEIDESDPDRDPESPNEDEDQNELQEEIESAPDSSPASDLDSDDQSDDR